MSIWVSKFAKRIYQTCQIFITQDCLSTFEELHNQISSVFDSFLQSCFELGHKLEIWKGLQAFQL